MRHILSSVILASVVATPLLAEGPAEMAVEARQGIMSAYALHLGVLGGMAKGEMAYDAAQAQLAADAIEALSGFDHSLLWPAGTANGEIDDSDAKPEIWANLADFTAKQTALHEAAVALQGAASGGQEGLGAALGGVGQACGACHELYRVKDE